MFLFFFRDTWFPFSGELVYSGSSNILVSCLCNRSSTAAFTDIPMLGDYNRVSWSTICPPPNERWPYDVTSSLIGCAQNDPWRVGLYTDSEPSWFRCKPGGITRFQTYLSFPFIHSFSPSLRPPAQRSTHTAEMNTNIHIYVLLSGWMIYMYNADD